MEVFTADAGAILAELADRAGKACDGETLLSITWQSGGKASQAGFSGSPYHLDVLPADAYRLPLFLPVARGVGDSAIMVNAGYAAVVRAVPPEESG